MIAPLYRTMALWVLIATVLISAAMAGATYFYQIEKVDDAIVDLAASEARAFAASHDDLFSRPSAEIIEAQLKQFLEAREASAQGHFIIAEFYDAEHRSLGEAAQASWSGVKAALSIKKHIFPDNNEPDYDKVTLDGRLYIRVVVPLETETGHRTLGYFEGVYHVSDARIADIRENILLAVLIWWVLWESGVPK